MKDLKEKIVKSSYLDLFLFFSYFHTVIFLLINHLTRGEVLRHLFNNTIQFVDFFMHLAICSDRTHLYYYPEFALFPPLPYLLYYFFWQLDPRIDPETPMNWDLFRDYGNNITLYIFYCMVLGFLLVYTIGQYYKKFGAKYNLLYPIALIFNYPMLCTTLERGNSVGLVAIMCALAWVWMDDESRVKQEIAMLLIAIAAAFKLYPAIMGLEYLRRKDWKRVIRLCIYGILFLVVPFAFFGGVDGAMHYLQNILYYSKYGYGMRTNTISGAMEVLFGTCIGLPMETASKIAKAVQMIYAAFCIGGMLLAEKKWQRTLFAAGMMASFLSSGFEYTCVCYLPVILVFTKENDGWIGSGSRANRVWNVVNVFFMGLIFTMPAYWYFVGIKAKTGVFSCGYVWLLLNAVDVTAQVVKRYVVKK